MAYRDQDILRVASMYYLQDVKMETIARHMGTSRSTVSRMIKEARDSGLVEITLRPAQSRAPGLRQHFRETWGVEAFVVPVMDSHSDESRHEQVALTCAKLVANWFQSEMVLSVAWGTTLSAIARHLPKKPTQGGAIVQLNGAANTRTSGVAYAGDLIASFAEAFDAHAVYFPVPAFFDFDETKEAMWRERSIRRVIEMQRAADIALFSVGALTGGLPSHVYSAGYLEQDDVETLDREGVVGDVCTVFLREDGTYADIPINSRATGPNPMQLKNIPRRVCAVSGDNKVTPLRAALRAGVITDLIIDEITATKFMINSD
ncbi:sugar-binding transcriptional regulator [Timonella senegalensis]|uniref:sugar-binding transcriptional regulator n=1 Tax=Timonella senegalensis TaxID=1465825 RepID=UPI0002D79A9C|nr:sugar-binding domain-containing protein [Timonella senegalensis]